MRAGTVCPELGNRRRSDSRRMELTHGGQTLSPDRSEIVTGRDVPTRVGSWPVHTARLGPASGVRKVQSLRMADEGFALDETYVHLGLGSIAVPMPDFTWDPEHLEAYSHRFASDGDEGLLVCITRQEATWTSWERHPAGDEMVLLLSGRVDFVLELPDELHVIELRPGRAMITPKAVWHTCTVHEPGDALFITPGAGTHHRDR